MNTSGIEMPVFKQIFRDTSRSCDGRQCFEWDKLNSENLHFWKLNSIWILIHFLKDFI